MLCTASHKSLLDGRAYAHIDTFGGRTTLKFACSRIERYRLAKRLGFCLSPLAPHPFPPHPYPHFAASRCHFYCRFWMPLLVVVWQSEITARYNIVEEGTARVEGIWELKLVSSLITQHPSFFLPAPRFTAFLLLSSRSIAFLCALCASAVKFGFPAPCSLLPASCSPFLLSPVIAENLIQNCQLNQFVARSAPSFALYLQELQ